MNLVLALIRIHKVPRSVVTVCLNRAQTEIKLFCRDHRLALIRNAVFGTDSLRFAAMLGESVVLGKSKES